MTGDYVAGDILVSGEHIRDRTGSAVIGGENQNVALLVRANSGQIGLCLGLSNIEIPIRRNLTDDFADFVTGELSLVLQSLCLGRVLNHKGSVSNLGLEHAPGALEEDKRVVVGSRAGVQVQGDAVARRGVVYQILTLSRADRKAVECHIVINRVRTGDQPVISNNGHTGSLGRFNGSCGSSTVLRADNQHGNSLGDQRLNVCLFSRGRTLAEHDLVSESGIAQDGLKLCLILQPSGLILGRQHDANLNGSARRLISGRLRSVGGLCTAGTTAAGQQADQ